MVFGEYVADLAVFDSINGIIFLVAFSECKFEIDREIEIRDRRTRTAPAQIGTSEKHRTNSHRPVRELRGAWIPD